MPDSTDIALLSTAVNTLVSSYGGTRDQMADLLAGPADGGPNGDGYYPVTAADGLTTVMVPSPLKISAIASQTAFGTIDVVYATRTLLDGDLAWAAGSVGFVTNDSTAANNDFYRKVGASGTGSWTLTTIIYDAIAHAAAPFLATASGSAAAAAASAAKAARFNAPFTSWSNLAAATGMAAGDKATVLVADTGTHADPVAGGTVANAGVYSYSASPAGWQRTGDTDTQTSAIQAGAAATAKTGAETARDEAESVIVSVTASQIRTLAIIARLHPFESL